MRASTITLLAALLPGFFSPVFAAYVGSKANLTITLTATSKVGGFLIKDADLAENESRGIVFSTPLNPLGFDPAVAGANYYSQKSTTKEKNYGTSAEPDYHPTEEVMETVTKVFSQKITNQEIMTELIRRGFLPGAVTSAKGYRLVAVFPANRPDLPEDVDAGPVLFFIENGVSIHYIGREFKNDYAATAADALLLTLGDDVGGYAPLLTFDPAVEAASFKSRVVYKHLKAGSEWMFDETGTRTDSESFSGKIHARVDFFPPVDDASTGATFVLTGLLSFSGRLDVANQMIVTSSASIPAAASKGSFWHEQFSEGSEDYAYYYGHITGGFSIGGTKAQADITSYLDALPAELAGLKAAILTSYGDAEGE